MRAVNASSPTLARLAESTKEELLFQNLVDSIRDGESSLRVARQLLAELSTVERLHLLDGDVPFYTGLRDILCDRYNRTPFIHGSIHRIGLPGIRFTDGPRGVVMGASTAFPISMARGATWDTSLERRVGNAIGLEGRAQGANYFAGVCINLPRHPAWGRIQETYGEDPILLGAFGSALTHGVQKHMMACVKHFALNSIENSRFRVDVKVDEDVLHEVYLPHFRQVVEAGVASVMSSYNSVNGQWAGQSEKLLTEILRHQWGFSGFTLSDFIFGLRDAVTSVKKGLDIEAPFSQQRAMHLKKALADGDLLLSDVDEAALRILRTQLEFGTRTLQEPPDTSVVFCKEHRRLAREVASRSVVLLKNETLDTNPLLPLDVRSISKLALIGRLSNTPNTGDKGSSQVFSPMVSTPYEGLQAAVPNVEVLLEDGDTAEGASKVASEADVAVCVVGYDASDEGEYVVPSLEHDPCLAELFPLPKTAEEIKTREIIGGQKSDEKKSSALEVGAGGDRKSLRLRSKDVEILRAAVKANPRTIVVVVCAGAVIMEEWRHQVPSILISWYAGSEGGHGLADVLLGKVNASGRLPFSIPKDEAHLPQFDMEATSITYDRWFGQSLLDKLRVEAAFPLGYGLSFTNFSFNDLSVQQHLEPQQEHISLAVTVVNSGSISGHHVAQVYGYPKMAEFPTRVLLGFASVEVEAASSVSIEIQASLRPIKRWRDGSFHLEARELDIEVASFAGDSHGIRATVLLTS